MVSFVTQSKSATVLQGKGDAPNIVEERGIPYSKIISVLVANLAFLLLASR